MPELSLFLDPSIRHAWHHLSIVPVNSYIEPV